VHNYPDEYWRDHDRRAEFPHDFFTAVANAGYLGVAIPSTTAAAVSASPKRRS